MSGKKDDVKVTEVAEVRIEAEAEVGQAFGIQVEEHGPRVHTIDVDLPLAAGLDIFLAVHPNRRLDRLPPNKVNRKGR